MKGNRGFTLIELVIAVALSAVLFMMLLTAMWQGQRFREKGEEREDISQKTRVLADRLTWLIRGAYPYSVKTEEGNYLYFSGTGSTLAFVTTSVDKFSEGPEDRAGLKWAEISAGDKGLIIKESVYFLESNLDGEGGTERVFDPDVRGIEFEYFDVDESGNDTWLTEWNPKDKSRLPRAVRVDVEFDYKGRSSSMPELVIKLYAGGQ